MENKLRLISYAFVFVLGYSINFLLPATFFSTQPLKGQHAGTNKPLAMGFNSDEHHASTITTGTTNQLVVSATQPDTSAQVVKPIVTADKVQALDKPEDLTAMRDELAMLREYRMKTEIDKHNAILQSRGGNSVEALNENFKREPVDTVWAKDKEVLINNVVENDESLSQMPLMSAECRSKQCKFAVLSDDQFYLHGLSASLDKIITDHESHFSSYTAVVDEKSHTTNIYFERN